MIIEQRMQVIFTWMLKKLTKEKKLDKKWGSIKRSTKVTSNDATFVIILNHSWKVSNILWWKERKRKRKRERERERERDRER